MAKRKGEKYVGSKETSEKLMKLIEELVEKGQKNGTFNPELNKHLARQMIFGMFDVLAGT